MDDAALARLTGALEADPRVVFAYLFGSQGRGTVGPTSDVDVAIWVRDTGEGDPLLDFIGVVTSALHRDDVDIVILNTAPLALAFASLKGRLLVNRDDRERVLREASIMSRYHDRAYYMRRHLAAFAERLRERGFA